MKTGIFQAFAIAILLALTGANSYAVDGRTAAILQTAAGPIAATLGDGSTDNQITVNLSKGVALQYTGIDDATNGRQYNMGTQHMSGNRQYATRSTTGGIWWNRCATIIAGTSTTCDYTEPTAGAVWNYDMTATPWTAL